MNISETRKGDLAIFGEEFLWSLFPVITILSFANFNPITSLAWSTVFATIFFAFTIFVGGKTKELFNPKIFRYIWPIVFFIGWLFYGLFFVGLKYTSADNAAIIALMELFFSYLLFNVWKKEIFSALHTLGAFLMLLGALIIVFPKQGLVFHGGDILILIASACAPLGNYYQQKLRKTLSSEVILFWRSLFTFPAFFLLALILRVQTSWNVAEKSLWFLLLNGFVVIGFSKILWLEGIHRISVTRAASLACVAPLFTLFFSYIILHQAPTIWQLFSLIPMGVGLVLLTYQKAPRKFS